MIRKYADFAQNVVCYRFEWVDIQKVWGIYNSLDMASKVDISYYLYRLFSSFSTFERNDTSSNWILQYAFQRSIKKICFSFLFLFVIFLLLFFFLSIQRFSSVLRNMVSVKITKMLDWLIKMLPWPVFCHLCYHGWLGHASFHPLIILFICLWT